MASLDSLIKLADFGKAISGQSKSSTQTTTGGTATQTKKTDLDQAAMDRMIQKMMSGQGGQASISGAARGAGLYNSSTEQQALNDLNTRVAGEIAQRSAPEVTTTTTPDKVTTAEESVPGIGLGGALAPLAIGAIGKPLLEGALGLAKGGSGGGLAGLLGGGGSGGIDAGNIVAGKGLEGTLGNTIGGSLSSLSSGGLTGMSAAGLGASLGSMDDFANVAFSSSLGPTAGGAAGAAGMGLEGMLAGMPAIGPMASLFMNPDSMNLGSFGMAALIPMVAAIPGIGAIAAPIMGILSSIMGSGGLSVVCTALVEKGLLDKELYTKGQAYIQTLHPYTIKGYYFWGEPLAAKILSGHKTAIKCSIPFAKQRTQLLAGQAWYKNPLGLFTKYVGEPGCFALGYVLTKLEIFNGTFRPDQSN